MAKTTDKREVKIDWRNVIYVGAVLLAACFFVVMCITVFQELMEKYYVQ